MTATYDRIGTTYGDLRRADPRIAAQIERALGNPRTVVNVGAGTGSYEPDDREVVAVEPSSEMISQRPPGSPRAVQTSAEALPFANDSFDAAMAVLTIHHWDDPRKGLQEMRRVSSGRIVVMTFDPAARPWLTDYLPGLAELDERQMPTIETLRDWLGEIRVEPVMVPHDCSDGFLYAYWRRPERYLDRHTRSGSSSFWALPDVATGLERLRSDLADEAWHRRYADVLASETYDAGYRLVIAEA